MSTLRKFGTLGSLGLLVSGSLIFGSANAAMAATCRTGLAAPASTTFTGTLVTATNFEGNTLSPFVKSTAGTGTVAVFSPKAHSGTCSVRIRATDTAGSVANMRLALPAGTKRASTDAWVNITTGGLAGNNVPYVRFFSGTTRVADVFRNNANGQLWLRTANPGGSVTYVKLQNASVPLNTWQRIRMQVRADGPRSTVQIWFGTVQVFNRTVNLPATVLSRVQFGAEHGRQMGDSYIDDIVVKRSAS
ncbi:hypothetical protein [Arthrobacter sp. QXT-31]|uniref:hypothetical protein n=1 Tax=Arthrobacter sp. QXT-31 TaxID=1357915 RepID=UPI000971994C|nr:hypothetical protein [Arthrobacter sp. QXT-31]APX00573.1 hypothetical protein BWQ92_01510 [Arthrobacter sp. QXT-31]